MDTGKHAVPYDSRDQFIYDRDLLLSFEGATGTFETENPRHEPGEPTHPGVTRTHGH
jgi:NADH-quinone oxidoreductase subunit I